jgi:hypothetical protein
MWHVHCRLQMPAQLAKFCSALIINLRLFLSLSRVQIPAGHGGGSRSARRGGGLLGGLCGQQRGHLARKASPRWHMRSADAGQYRCSIYGPMFFFGSAAATSADEVVIVVQWGGWGAVCLLSACGNCPLSTTARAGPAFKKRGKKTMAASRSIAETCKWKLLPH